jgi:hypothetical protein
VARRILRAVALFLAVTALHLLVSLALIVYIFSTGMARFDTGVPAGALEQLANGAFAILRLPLLSLLERMPMARSPGLRSYLPFLGNAACWGAAAVAVRVVQRARVSRRGSP